MSETRSIPASTTAPAGSPIKAVAKAEAPAEAAPSSQVVMRHNESGGTTVVSRSAFEGTYRYNGWEELTDADRETLLTEARAQGVNIPDDAGMIEIVASVDAYRVSKREV